jgi:hypothetical protein
MMSAPLPGGNEQMKCISFDGYFSCALAGAAANAAVNKASAPEMADLSTSLSCSGWELFVLSFRLEKYPVCGLPTQHLHAVTRNVFLHRGPAHRADQQINVLPSGVPDVELRVEAVGRNNKCSRVPDERASRAMIRDPGAKQG